MKHFAQTLYHDSRNGGTKQWSIWIEDDGLTITVEWGIRGGKMQRSSDKSKALPTKDEFAVCTESYARQVREKREEGYVSEDEYDTPATATYDPLTGLTKLFVPAKPIAKLKVEDLLKAERTGNMWIQRKRDGERHLVLKDRKGIIHIYSRRMEDRTANFPKLVDALSRLRIPNGTILDGEIIVDRNGDDDFRSVGSVTRSKAARGAAQEATLPVRYMVFDVLYFDGRTVFGEPYVKRYAYLTTITEIDTGMVFRPMVLNRTGKSQGLEYWMQHAKDNGWEGLVCWFIDQPTVVREGGKPTRTGCAKWKPKREKDFIATGYYLGSGNMSDVVGGLNISEYMPDGTLRSCGNVGGFKGDSSIRREALTWKYPCVVSVEFDKQEPEGKLRFPVVVKLHEDKPLHECVFEEFDDEDEE